MWLTRNFALQKIKKKFFLVSMKKLWLYLLSKVSYFCQFWQYLENNSGDVWPIYIGRGNSVIGSQSFPISLTLKHYKKFWNYASYLSLFHPYLFHIFSFLGQFSVRRRGCFSAKRVWGLLGEKLPQQFTTKPSHLDLLSLQPKTFYWVRKNDCKASQFWLSFSAKSSINFCSTC